MMERIGVQWRLLKESKDRMAFSTYMPFPLKHLSCYLSGFSSPPEKLFEGIAWEKTRWVKNAKKTHHLPLVGVSHERKSQNAAEDLSHNTKEVHRTDSFI